MGYIDCTETLKEITNSLKEGNRIQERTAVALEGIEDALKVAGNALMIRALTEFSKLTPDQMVVYNVNLEEYRAHGFMNDNVEIKVEDDGISSLEL